MRNGHKVIDSDGHVIEPGDLWERYIEPEYAHLRPICNSDPIHFTVSVLGREMSRVIETAGSDAVTQKLRSRGAVHAEAIARGFDARSQLDAMDSAGIDVMVLFPSRGLYANAVADMEGGLSAAICRAYNRWLRDFCDAAPDRLVPIAMGTLHDPVKGVAEARYAVEELGMHGVMVRPNPHHGRNLHDRAYQPFYEELERLGVPLAIHEGCGVFMPEFGVDRYSERIAWHAMCHPMEHMGAVYSFTTGGVMERHPQLQVVFLEAGSTWLPFWLHRLDEHVELYDATVPELTRLPSEYFRRQGWISFEPDEPGIRTLVDAVGIERLLWSSDYPHTDGTWPGAVDELFDCGDLSDDERRATVESNPSQLWNISLAPAAARR